MAGGAGTIFDATVGFTPISATLPYKNIKDAQHFRQVRAKYPVPILVAGKMSCSFQFSFHEILQASLTWGRTTA